METFIIQPYKTNNSFSDIVFYEVQSAFKDSNPV